MIKRVILTVGHGQTCNRLWQVVHWLPTAERLGFPLYVPSFRRYARLFAGTAGVGVPRYPRAAAPLPAALDGWARVTTACANARPAWAGRFCRAIGCLPGHVAVDLGALRGGPQELVHPLRVLEWAERHGGGTVWVHGSGWCVDSEGLGVYREQVCGFFAPDHATAQRVAGIAKDGRASGVVLIGMHLRRGDYRTWGGGKYCYDDATFGRVMRQMAQVLAPRPARFLLVSDEPVDVRNFAGFDVMTGPGDMLSDLYALAACDYIIGPPSTFTSWASYYGNAPLWHLQDPSAPLRLDAFRVA